MSEFRTAYKAFTCTALHNNELITFLLFVVKCVNVIARISVKNYDTMGIYQN